MPEIIQDISPKWIASLVVFVVLGITAARWPKGKDRRFKVVRQNEPVKGVLLLVDSDKTKLVTGDDGMTIARRTKDGPLPVEVFVPSERNGQVIYETESETIIVAPTDQTLTIDIS